MVIFTVCLSAFLCCNAGAKYADLAGKWYSSSKSALRAELSRYLQEAHVRPIDGDIIGVIAPHAGFRASGPIAAYAYKAILGKKPATLIIVGFTHRYHLPNKIAILTDKFYGTPLGKAAINRGMTQKFMDFSRDIEDIPQAFSVENSVELEIPFAQMVAPDAELVVIALCDQNLKNCQVLADALYNVLRDETDYVIVASTDMCHYLPYDQANKLDARTIESLKRFDPDGLYFESLRKNHQLMCGYGAVYAVMKACKDLGADEVRILKYANSGDTLGSFQGGVVGYVSAAFIRSTAPSVNKDNTRGDDNMFNQEQRSKLLRVARDTISHYLRTGKRLDVNVDDDLLKQEMGAFVTLHKKGQLRGCIGHMAATGPLHLTVRDMAIAAATEDPRFPRVQLDELDDIDIEISALSPMKKIDDYNTIEMGKHGVMVRMGWRSGVYLPQVATETGWDRDQFMNSLCGQKAGIPHSAWKTGDCDIYIFTAEVFGEKTGREQ